jgi:hypothetical protein
VVIDRPKQFSFLDTREEKRELAISEADTPDATVTFFHGDRLDLLGQIADSGSQAELIATSPPYNVGKEYEKHKPVYEPDPSTAIARVPEEWDTGSDSARQSLFWNRG